MIDDNQPVESELMLKLYATMTIESSDYRILCEPGPLLYSEALPTTALILCLS